LIIKSFMRYEEIFIGMKESLTHQVTQQDIEKFVDLTGDDNKLHVDKAFAATTSFKKPVVHGMIGASFISTIIGTKLPGDGALWFSQTLEFLLPVRVGDKLVVEAEVTKKNDNERIIDLKIEILNQNRQVVTKGLSRVKVIEPEVAESVAVEAGPVTRAALVIGGSGGIGKAVCLQLAKDNFDVAVHYKSNASVAALIQKEITALGRQCILVQADVDNEAEVDEMIRLALRKFGRIDVLVNCAASPIPPIKVLDLEWTDFEVQLNLNIKVNLQLIKRVLPGMMENKGGKIITIGTVYVDKPNASLVHYITAKAALEGFTKAMALELAPKGIQVNMVAPSVISTELTSDIPEKVKLLTAAQTPLRRLALPEDVAGAVSFLAGNQSNFLSGEVIRVNGGQVMK
jgi:3-oxoacyl-[acyl-carrier protein] reductase